VFQYDRACFQIEVSTDVGVINSTVTRCINVPKMHQYNVTMNMKTTVQLFVGLTTSGITSNVIIADRLRCIIINVYVVKMAH